MRRLRPHFANHRSKDHRVQMAKCFCQAKPFGSWKPPCLPNLRRLKYCMT